MVCWLYPFTPQREPRVFSLEGLKETWKADRLSFSYAPSYPLLLPLLYSPVDSLSPELSWSGFPRDIDRKGLDPAVLGVIKDVTYDLKIWEAVRGSKGRLAYERRGLKGTEASFGKASGAKQTVFLVISRHVHVWRTADGNSLGYVPPRES